MGSGSRWGPLLGASPTHMSSYTKVEAGWLRYCEAMCGREYLLTALENQRASGCVLRFDDPLTDDPRYYYILEARDHDAYYGAPHSGVMVYHITHDSTARHAVVNTVRTEPERRVVDGLESTELPTLHGIGHPHGVTEYVNRMAGIRVRLLVESNSPYQASLRLDCMGS